MPRKVPIDASRERSPPQHPRHVPRIKPVLRKLPAQIKRPEVVFDLWRAGKAEIFMKMRPQRC